MPGFVVLRSSGHAGSRWLSELLATQNLTFLFEFSGHCSERYGAASRLSIHDIFGAGCACRLDQAMEPVCASDEDGRIHSMSCVKDAFCAQRCPQLDGRSCRAVGMVDSYQPAMVQRLAAARAVRPFAIATFERDNAIKHAISKLRASCGGTNLKGNHIKKPLASASAAAAGAAPPAAPALPPVADISLMHIESRLLLAEAKQSLLGRRLMHAGVRRSLGPPTMSLHYEDLQRTPAMALRSLLAAVGAGALDEAALARTALIKGSSDSLRTTLLNYGELHSSLRHVPCMQRMLEASSPERFAADCALDDEELEGPVPHHQAKQDTHTRVLWCRQPPRRVPPSPSLVHATPLGNGAPTTDDVSSPPSPTCLVASMNAAAAAEAAALARASGSKGRRHARINGLFKPLPQPTVRKSSLSATRAANGSRLAHADVLAMIAGECTQEEERMCTRALSRAAANGRAPGSGGGSSNSDGGASAEPDRARELFAEVCVLRAVGGDGSRRRRGI